MRLLQYPDDLPSKFQFITVAALRCRQLQKGAQPRVHSRSKKFTTIAQEEVMGGMIPFTDEAAALAAMDNESPAAE
jgi:DNA-directed RNA polymerase subunit omega